MTAPALYYLVRREDNSHVGCLSMEYHGLAQFSDSSGGNSRATTVTLYLPVASAWAAERPITPAPMIPISMLQYSCQEGRYECRAEVEVEV